MRGTHSQHPFARPFVTHNHKTNASQGNKYCKAAKAQPITQPITNKGRLHVFATSANSISLLCNRCLSVAVLEAIYRIDVVRYVMRYDQLSHQIQEKYDPKANDGRTININTYTCAIFLSKLSLAIKSSFLQYQHTPTQDHYNFIYHTRSV